MQWRWEDYSNRVWISVSGVGLEDRSNILKQVNFSYSPSAGKSSAEAIAVSSFNMFTGRQAEEFLLRVLFGVRDGSVSHSNLLSNGKAFHIYRFTTPQGLTNTVFFDGTMYHNLF
jgi:hypothetical protein